MAQTSKTFRIFVSSTFSDLKEERNALQKYVFPKLRDLCMQHGCRFQAIDLRWGISEEASHDQQTMKICLEEIRRCQRVFARPNFIVLLGDRYGWCPLPYEIPADEFEALLQNVSHANEKELLTHWYKRDDNAVPPVYDLQPREGAFADSAKWKSVEHRLRSILLATIQNLPLTLDERLKYEASATEQEIIQGALRVQDASEHVFGFFREIKTKEGKPIAEHLPEDEGLGRYVDLIRPGVLDAEAHNLQEKLKSRLRDHLCGNIVEYEATWTGDAITTDHIGSLPESMLECRRLLEEGYVPVTLCEAVWQKLGQMIESQIEYIEEDPMKMERDSHWRFAEQRAEHFVGRQDHLDKIADYLNSSTHSPLLIHGASGCGKTALMGHAAISLNIPTQQENSWTVVARFIGATPDSTQIRALLESLCRQIANTYGNDSPVPTDYRELVLDFRKRLSLAHAERRLVLFLDGLDQLADTDNARALHWLPDELPEHVRVIVSTLPGECLSTLERKLPTKSLLELESMPLTEGRKLLELWLEDVSRTLQDHQRDEILDKFEPHGLPLYLKLAFEEARRWRSYDKVPNYEGKNGIAEDIPGIIRNLFWRLSQPKNHGELLVSRSMGYLATAKNGVSENELLDILSYDEEVFQDFMGRTHHEPPEQRLPMVIWSRLYFDLEPYLIERTVDGLSLLAFYHHQVREVVHQEYLSGKEKLQTHKRLASYFSDIVTHRSQTQYQDPHALVELPYQYANSDQKEKLESLLSNIPYLDDRCQLCNIYELIQDFELTGSQLDDTLNQYRDFIRKHAQRLTRYRGTLFALIQREGFPAVRTQAQELVNMGLWKKPWLRLKPARIPTPVESGLITEQVEIIMEVKLGNGCLSDMAQEKGVIFFLKKRRQIGIIDIENGQELPETVRVRPLFPLELFCSSNGEFVVVAFDNGEADLMKIEYNENGSLIDQRHLKTFQYVLPEYEAPIMSFIDNNLWFQAQSGCTITTLNLDEPGIDLSSQALSSDPVDAELSSIIPMPNSIVLTFRSTKDTYLFAVNERAVLETLYFKGVDVASSCTCGDQLFAIALTDRKVCVFDNSNFSNVREIKLDELPLCMVFASETMLIIDGNGQLRKWVWGEDNTLLNLSSSGTRFIRARRLGCKRDETFIALVFDGYRSFIITQAGIENSSTTHIVFNAERRDSYYAIQRRKNTLYALNSISNEEMQLNNISNEERWFEENSSIKTGKYAIDGVNNILGTKRSTVQGSLVALTSGSINILEDLPPQISSIAGSVRGGFWLTDHVGAIFFVNVHGECSRIPKAGIDILEKSEIQAWDGLVICSGTSKQETQFGPSMVYSILFFLPRSEDSGELEYIGCRHLEGGDGLLQKIIYDPIQKHVLMFLKGSLKSEQSVKLGTPEDFVNNREQEQELHGIDGVLLDAAFSMDATGIFLLSKTGNLLYLDRKSLKVQATLTGSVPITSIAQNPIQDTTLALVEGKQTISFCTFIGGVNS